MIWSCVVVNSWLAARSACSVVWGCVHSARTRCIRSDSYTFNIVRTHTRTYAQSATVKDEHLLLWLTAGGWHVESVRTIYGTCTRRRVGGVPVVSSAWHTVSECSARLHRICNGKTLAVVSVRERESIHKRSAANMRASSEGNFVSVCAPGQNRAHVADPYTVYTTGAHATTFIFSSGSFCSFAAAAAVAASAENPLCVGGTAQTTHAIATVCRLLCRHYATRIGFL